MKLMKALCLPALLILVFTSCKDKDEESVCPTTTSPFQDVHASMISSGHTDDVSFDTEIHEYSFSISEDKEVCLIGYQSQPAISSTPYTIQIYDNTASSLVYNGSHTFSSSETEYVEPSSAINLTAGTSYTVKRIQTDWGTNIGNTIGRITGTSVMTFPYTSGIMTIDSADFYQMGGPITNAAIPYIDLILK